MIGIWNAHSQAWLLTLFAVTMPVFALPIFFVPLAWARVFRWRIPQDTDLAVYFGRCLGAFILVIEAQMLRAGLNGAGLLFTYQALLGVSASMVLVHVVDRDAGDRHVRRHVRADPAVLPAGDAGPLNF